MEALGPILVQARLRHRASRGAQGPLSYYSSPGGKKANVLYLEILPTCHRHVPCQKTSVQKRGAKVEFPGRRALEATIDSTKMGWNWKLSVLTGPYVDASRQEEKVFAQLAWEKRMTPEGQMDCELPSTKHSQELTYIRECNAFHILRMQSKYRDIHLIIPYARL